MLQENELILQQTYISLEYRYCHPLVSFMTSLDEFSSKLK